MNKYVIYFHALDDSSLPPLNKAKFLALLYNATLFTAVLYGASASPMQEAEAAKLIKQGKKIFGTEDYPELIDFSNGLFFDPTLYDKINGETAAFEILHEMMPTSAGAYVDIYDPKAPPPLYAGLTLTSNHNSSNSIQSSEYAKRKSIDIEYEKLLEDLNLERFKRR